MSWLERTWWQLRLGADMVRCHIWWKTDGRWEWVHEFKTCPSGERHCPHVYWAWEKKSST